MSGKAAELKRVLIERIRTGGYAVGKRLPGVRKAADEFGVHANTVSLVYGELADMGIVRSVHGSGTFVVALPPLDGQPSAIDSLTTSVQRLAAEASRLGVSRGEWGRLTAEAGELAFANDVPTMWFVECSPKDTEELAASLGTILARNVRPLLVWDVGHTLASDDSARHFFITTPFHVEEVEAAVNGRFPVVNVNVIPTPETLVSFARIDPSASVSVLASNGATLGRFVKMIRSYTRMEPRSALVTDPEAANIARGAEVLIDSQSIHDKVMNFEPTGKTITVRYQIEPTSVTYVREILRRRTGAGRDAWGENPRRTTANSGSATPPPVDARG